MSATFSVVSSTRYKHAIIDISQVTRYDELAFKIIMDFISQQNVSTLLLLALLPSSRE
jgi:anti-anti-sigma regulatory factor